MRRLKGSTCYAVRFHIYTTTYGCKFAPVPELPAEEIDVDVDTEPAGVKLCEWFADTPPEFTEKVCEWSALALPAEAVMPVVAAWLPLIPEFKVPEEPPALFV